MWVGGWVGEKKKGLTELLDASHGWVGGYLSVGELTEIGVDHSAADDAADGGVRQALEEKDVPPEFQPGWFGWVGGRVEEEKEAV